MIYGDPYVILTLTVSDRWPLFIRVASVNNKGSTLSDFSFIHRNLSINSMSQPIEQFQCHFDEKSLSLRLKWSMLIKSMVYVDQFVLYYTDMNDIVRSFSLPMDLIDRIQHKYWIDFVSPLNTSMLMLKSHRYHILRLYLTVMDRQRNQHFIKSSTIYCMLPKRYGT